MGKRKQSASLLDALAFFESKEQVQALEDWENSKKITPISQTPDTDQLKLGGETTCQHPIYLL